MASAERKPIRGMGAEPPAGSRGRAPGQGGKAPLKLKCFKALYFERTGNICPFTQLLKVMKISPKLLRIKVGLRYTKMHTECVREREQTELSHLQCI